MKSIMKHYEGKFKMIHSLLSKDDPVVVEIGAHYGEDSLRFLETFKNIELYCFEPDPRNISIFKKYVNDERVELFELALSNEKGEAKFYQSYQDGTETPEKYDWIDSEEYTNKALNNSGSSSLKKGYSYLLGEPVNVRTERYDSWCLENDVTEVDFVWMDVQGAEKDVLLGMGEQIKNIRYIWMEYGERNYEGSMTRDETVAFLTSLGFIENKELSDKSSQGDILFVRE